MRENPVDRGSSARTRGVYRDGGSRAIRYFPDQLDAVRVGRHAQHAVARHDMHLKTGR